MKKITLILTVLSFYIFKANADIGRFDVIKIEINNSEYYLSIFSMGILKNHNLYYYTWDGKKKDKVEDVLINSLSRLDTIELYKELHTINIEKFDEYSDNFTNTLFIFKKRVKMSREYVLKNLKLIDAFNGNTFGYIYSDDLNNNDNIWINDYPIEKLFFLTDYELCSMSLYGIKGNVSKQEKIKIRRKLDSYLKKFKREKFKSELKKLYKEHIIMIGFCSC